MTSVEIASSVDAIVERSETLRNWDSLMAEPSLEWLIDRLLPVGGLSLLVGGPKVGKSTLLRELLASHGSGGGPWLGRDNLTEGGPFLYVALDEHPSMVKEHFTKLIHCYPEDALAFSAHFVTTPVSMEALCALIAESEASLCAIDTLGQFAADAVEDGNSYQAWQHTMNGLRQVATETHCHILALHHARKSGGRRGQSTLGSQAIAGAVDTIIEMEATLTAGGEYRRTVSSTNRAGEDIPLTPLLLDQANGSVSVDKARQSQVAAIDEAQQMRDGGMSVRQIADELGVSKSWVAKYTDRPHE